MPRNFIMPGAPQSRAPTMRGNAELEMAKTTLRRAGYVVFNSSVDGGPKGMIRCDGRDFDSFTVIEMARKVK